MTRGATLLAALSAAGIVAIAQPASAQLSETGGPVSYSADNLEYFDSEHRLVLTGNVDIVQQDARLRSDKVTLYFSASTARPGSSSGLGAGDIERMIAEGDVYYVRPAQSARGDRADYEVHSDAVTFTGNVVVASNENVIRGDTMVLHISSRQTVLRPRAGGRVQGVFVQQHGQQGQTPGNSQRTPPANPPPAQPH